MGEVYRAEDLKLGQIAGEMVFYAAILWAFYTAFEPYGRRIWPTIFISWNRLVGVSRRRMADPLLVGRSILVGLAVGSVLTFAPTLVYALETWYQGVPLRPPVNPNQMLLGAPAISAVLRAVNFSMAMGLLIAFSLILGRYLFRKPWAAVPFAVAINVVLMEGFTVTGALVGVIVGIALIGLLLRGGLVALFAAMLAVQFGPIAMGTDWGAWHARTIILTLIVIAALAAYGAAAAMSGWAWGDDEAGAQ